MSNLNQINFIFNICQIEIKTFQNILYVKYVKCSSMLMFRNNHVKILFIFKYVSLNFISE